MSNTGAALESASSGRVPHLDPWLRKYFRLSDAVCPALYMREIRDQREPEVCWACPAKSSLTHSWKYSEPCSTVMARPKCNYCSGTTWVTVDKAIRVKRPLD